MKYIIFFSIILFISLDVFSQRSLFNQRYDKLAADFKLSDFELKEYRNDGKLEIFNAEKHKTSLARKLLKMKNGKSKKIDNGYYTTIYKIISKEVIPHYRVRYIYVDKSKFKTTEDQKAYLKKIRNLLEKTAFKSVAMQYSMDYRKNVGGDSGWFKEGKTESSFFKQISGSNRLAEEIFEFEIPENNAYYFVQKTHATKDIEEALVLQTKEN